jgi:uncharacterized protein involved in response to NO
MVFNKYHFNASLKAQDVFFPVACLAAIVLAILSQLARLGLVPLAQKLNGLGHAHEMLFGFVLLLISGYTLGKVSGLKIVVMLLLWLLARVCFLYSTDVFWSEIFNIGFSLLMVWHILPRFVVAKKWRNRMIVPLLLAIFSFPTVWFVVINLTDSISSQQLIHSLLILLVMLMTFIAGRVLAPALAGAMHAQNYELKARVQPNVEAALLVLPVLASLLLFLPVTPKLTAIILMAMGTLLAVRMMRWQFWRAYQRSDLMALIVGYAYLLLGSLLLAFNLSFNLTDMQLRQGTLHIITMAAIGTLSSVVMLKYALHKHSHPAHIFYSVVVLILLATIARVWADYSLYRNTLLNVSVGFWSLNYLMVLIKLLQSYYKNTILS